MTQDILSLPPPPADERVRYGSGPQHFADLRLPQGKGPFPVVMNIHGGFWRNKYDLAHAGHLCAGLTERGFATWNVEYRRVGDPGGGWPGTFEDLQAAYQHIPQAGRQYHFDLQKVVVMGHSAGGHLAICLAAHEPSVKRAISLAGVVDLQAAFDRHLSNDAVVEFMGGKPSEVPEHYAEADPMKLKIPHAKQWLIHGDADDVVPTDFSRRYVKSKKKSGEHARLVEIARCGHFELIDPRSEPWKAVLAAVNEAV
jgi:acetyl esterase/lipase